MKDSKLKKTVITHIQEVTGPELDAKILTDVYRTMDDARPSVVAGGRLTIWRIMMKSKITRFAAAAAVLILVLTGLMYFQSTSNGTGVVLADVIEKMKPVSTVTHRETWTVTVVGDDKPFMHLDVFKYAATDKGVVVHLHYSDGSPMKQIYFLLPEKKGTILFPQAKKYLHVPLEEKFLRRLSQLTPKGIVTWIQEGAYKKLPRQNIEGVTAQGFELKNPPALNDFMEIQDSLFPIKESRVRLWVDVETSLPVAVEMELLTGRGVFTGYQELKIDTYAYDLHWGAIIDPEMFVPDIPDDYTPFVPFPKEKGVDSIKKILGIESKEKE